MIRPGTFDKSYVFSDDLAFQMNYFFQGKMGVMKGCNVTNDGVGNLSVSDGFFTICGRILNNIGNTLIPIPVVASGTLYSILVYEVDLTQINTETQFNQGALKIISNGSAYPTLTKQDLNDGGTLYQYEFCRFANTSAGAGTLTDTRVMLDMSTYLMPSDIAITDVEYTFASSYIDTRTIGCQKSGKSVIVSGVLFLKSGLATEGYYNLITLSKKPVGDVKFNYTLKSATEDTTGDGSIASNGVMYFNHTGNMSSAKIVFHLSYFTND